jgi:hypothetical protein
LSSIIKESGGGNRPGDIEGDEEVPDRKEIPFSQ